jgi:hypothetical protein
LLVLDRSLNSLIVVMMHTSIWSLDYLGNRKKAEINYLSG